MRTSIFKQFVLAIFATIFIFVSCKKDSRNSQGKGFHLPTSSSALGSFYESNINEETQYFTINANVTQLIVGAKGTKLYFQPNIFRGPSGEVVTGNITIELIEVVSKSDMILLKKTTTSNNNILESGGAFSVKAFQQGNQLSMSSDISNKSIYVEMPSENPGKSDMKLFSGIPTSTGNVNWVLTGLNGPNNVIIPDTNGKAAYTFFLGNDSLPMPDSLGFINVDRFYNNADTTKIAIITPVNHVGFVNGSPTYLNTDVYLYFEAFHAVAPLMSNKNMFFLTKVPIGEQVKIVAISEIDGQYYIAIKSITISVNHNENIILTPTTAGDIKSQLKNL